MDLLKILKPIRMNSKIVQPGQMVKVIDEQTLIDRGIARRLTEDDAQAILHEYVQCAESLFSEIPQRNTISFGEHKTIHQGRLLQERLTMTVK
ncbi:MAG TPA: hypothetical protein VMT62_12015 [Syntrophorhabdaceae bacterium]|nr:hypothetical protein [Syntrophorhabdaceae bacterium]